MKRDAGLKSQIFKKLLNVSDALNKEALRASMLQLKQIAGMNTISRFNDHLASGSILRTLLAKQNQKVTKRYFDRLSFDVRRLNFRKSHLRSIIKHQMVQKYRQFFDIWRK